MAACGNGAASGACQAGTATLERPQTIARRNSQTVDTAVIVKEEKDDGIPPKQSDEEFVSLHPALNRLWRFYSEGRQGTSTCGFKLPWGSKYAAEQEDRLAICKACKPKTASSKRVPKLFTDAIAENRLPEVNKGAGAKNAKLWYEQAATFLRRWTVEMLEIWNDGIHDEAQAQTIFRLALPSAVVKIENGGRVGSPAPTATTSLPSTPLEARDGTPAMEVNLDSASPTQQHASTPTFSPSAPTQLFNSEDDAPSQREIVSQEVSLSP